MKTIDTTESKECYGDHFKCDECNLVKSGGKVFNPIKVNEFRDADLGRPADRGSAADPVLYNKDTNAKETRLTA